MAEEGKLSRQRWRILHECVYRALVYTYQLLYSSTYTHHVPIQTIIGIIGIIAYNIMRHQRLDTYMRSTVEYAREKHLESAINSELFICHKLWICWSTKRDILGNEYVTSTNLNLQYKQGSMSAFIRHGTKADKQSSPCLSSKHTFIQMIRSDRGEGGH